MFEGKRNINDYVWVKLTPAGERVLVEHDQQALGERYHVHEEHLRTSRLEEGLTGLARFQLWELMNIFGPQMYNGAIETMFEDNVIYYELPSGT